MGSKERDSCRPPSAIGEERAAPSATRATRGTHQENRRADTKAAHGTACAWLCQEGFSADSLEWQGAGARSGVTQVSESGLARLRKTTPNPVPPEMQAAFLTEVAEELSGTSHTYIRPIAARLKHERDAGRVVFHDFIKWLLEKREECLRHGLKEAFVRRLHLFAEEKFVHGCLKKRAISEHRRRKAARRRYVTDEMLEDGNTRTNRKEE